MVPWIPADTADGSGGEPAEIADGYPRQSGQDDSDCDGHTRTDQHANIHGNPDADCYPNTSTNQHTVPDIHSHPCADQHASSHA